MQNTQHLLGMQDRILFTASAPAKVEGHLCLRPWKPTDIVFAPPGLMTLKRRTWIPNSYADTDRKLIITGYLINLYSFI